MLAAQVRALANEAHQAASFAARQQRDVSNLAQRVASAASGSNDGSLRSVLALVETAARALGQCAAQLETTAQRGKSYATTLAESPAAAMGGSSSAPGGSQQEQPEAAGYARQPSGEKPPAREYSDLADALAEAVEKLPLEVPEGLPPAIQVLPYVPDTLRYFNDALRDWLARRRRP